MLDENPDRMDVFSEGSVINIIIYDNIYANKPNIAQTNTKPKSPAQAAKNSSINV